MEASDVPTEFSMRQIADATGLGDPRPVLAMMRREGVAYRKGGRLWYVKGPCLREVEPDYYERCVQVFGKKRQR